MHNNEVMSFDDEKLIIVDENDNDSVMRIRRSL